MFGQNAGMIMMLKSLGLDTDALAKGAEDFMNIAKTFNERVGHIEEKLDLLLQNPVLNQVPQVQHENELEFMETTTCLKKLQ